MLMVTRLGECEGSSLRSIKKLCLDGHLNEALRNVEVHEKRGLRVTFRILLCLLEGCIKHKDLTIGRKVNSFIARKGFKLDTFLGSHLVRMFACCGSLSEANLVYKKMSDRSIYTWHSIISAHVKLGNSEQAIQLYHQLLNTTIRPNEYINVAVLKACANLGAFYEGNLVVSYIIEDGLEPDLYVGNTMMDMYAKCGCLREAHKLFNSMVTRDAVSWNALITGFAQHEHCLEAVWLLQQMQQEGMCPDDVTFACVIKACAIANDLEKGAYIHQCVVESGYGCDTHVANVLIHMYMACGSMNDASIIFEKLPKRDVVTWSSMISGYTHHGYGDEALKAFKRMQEEDLRPNNVTYPSILNACADAVDLDPGRLTHFHIMESDYEGDVYIGSALIDMYGKCGSLEDAVGVFKQFLTPHEVIWNSMMAAYAQAERGEEALELFEQVLLLGVFEPDRVAYLSPLKACSSVASLDWGKLLHDQIVRREFAAELSIGNALIDMYAKCGSLADAQRVFEDIPERGIITWSTMVAAYALYNEYELVFECFEEMQKVGVKPNNVTFVSLLSACSQKGFIDKGYDYFLSMKSSYGIKPATEHVNCMVDLLGRAGRTHEAEQLLITMPFKNKALGWKSLLSHCKSYDHVERARRCFDQLIAIDPRDASQYAIMQDIYVNANMWDNVREIQEMRKQVGVWIKPGKAFIQVENKIHSFTVGEKSDAKIKLVKDRLKTVALHMKEIRSLARLASLLASAYEEDMVDVLCGHCERLAIGFGLIKTPYGTTLRISKNLRVCSDCHAFTGFISQLEKRDIIIIDTFRVHHFSNGVCCCNDHDFSFGGALSPSLQRDTRVGMPVCLKG